MDGKFNSQADFIHKAKLGLTSNPKDVMKNVPIGEKRIKY